MERGVIQYRERKQQIISFEHIRMGKITPTDIDMCIEYKDKVFILGEFKLIGVEIQRGQELAFMRLCDDIQRGGKDAFFLICRHSMQDCHKDIEADIAIVEKFYFLQEWRNPQVETTVAEAITKIIDSYSPVLF